MRLTAAAVVIVAFAGCSQTGLAVSPQVSPSFAGRAFARGNALESKQTLYVPSYVDNVVTTYDMNGKPGKTISQGVDGPFGVAVDAKGKIYVTNDKSGTVTTYLPNGTETTPTITGIVNPYGIAVGKNGKIYVISEASGSSCSSGTVYTYTSKGVRTSPTIDIPGAPVGIAVDGRNKIYVSNFCAGPSGQGEVATYEPDGTPTKPVLTDADNIDTPFGLAIVQDKLFVANSSGSYDHSFEGYVTTYTLDGKQVTPWISEAMNGPQGIAVDNEGKIFVVNALAGNYGEIDAYKPNGKQTKPTIVEGIREPFLIAIH